MDESGILTLDNSEALFEVEYEEVSTSDHYENLSDAVGDAISKFGNTISKLFSGNEDVSGFKLSVMSISFSANGCSSTIWLRV